MNARIKRLAAAGRSPEQEVLFRSLVEGPRGTTIVLEDGSLFGPFNAMLRSPAIGDRLQSLGLAVQGPDALPPTIREAVVLTVAGRRGSEGEWNAHLPRATAAGLTSDDLDRIGRGDFPVDAPADLHAALELTHHQLAHSPVDNELYARALSALGERGIFEVTALAGYYDTLCSILSVFRIDQRGNNQP